MHSCRNGSACAWSGQVLAAGRQGSGWCSHSDYQSTRHSGQQAVGLGKADKNEGKTDSSVRRAINMVFPCDRGLPIGQRFVALFSTCPISPRQPA